MCVYNGSHRSNVHLRLQAQRRLTFVSGFTLGVLSLHRETKFSIGYDFAVTLSSPESFRVLFDITSEHSVELKRLMLNKHKKMIPFITCEISLGQYDCELVFGVNVFDLDFGLQIDSIK